MATHFKGPILGRDEPQKPNGWRSNLPIGSDPDYVVFFNDFIKGDDFVAADWVIFTTEAGGGAATEALGPQEVGGALVITNDNFDNDLDSLQQADGAGAVGEYWQLSAGKRLWFNMKVKVTDADQQDNFYGLCITDTTPLAATDRIGFQTTDASASIDVLCEKDSTETLTASGVDGVDATYNDLKFYWDGISRVYYYVDNALVATHSTNIPDDEQLALTIHHQNGEAAANVCTIDYIHIVMER